MIMRISTGTIWSKTLPTPGKLGGSGGRMVAQAGTSGYAHVVIKQKTSQCIPDIARCKFKSEIIVGPQSFAALIHTLTVRV